MLELLLLLFKPTFDVLKTEVVPTFSIFLPLFSFSEKYHSKQIII